MRQLLTVLLTVVVVGSIGILPAAANEGDRVQLGIKPVGVRGSYFELTLEPGEARQLAVEVGNYGSPDAVALLYPADVYSLVNGGMGVRLADEPTGPTTNWLGIAAESIALAGGQAVVRTFAISVPDNAEPGEYITSIVVEDATPLEAEAADGVTTQRVNRHAIAVVVTIPGPTAPALSLGEVAHRITGGRSVISVEVHNDGNVRLQPSGELILSSGDEQLTFPIRMDSVYAGTSTLAEIPFTTIIEPGKLTATVRLTDKRHDVSAATPTVSLVVDHDQPSSPMTHSAANQAASDEPPATVSGMKARVIVLVIMVVGLLVVGSLAVRRRLTRQPGTGVTATTTQPVAPVRTLARPVSVRQLAVPARSQPSPERGIAGGGMAQFRRLSDHRPLANSHGIGTNGVNDASA
jgi:hypothetical protein